MDFFQDHQMPRPVECLQVDIGHTTYLDIIERQGPLNMNDASRLLKESLAQIRGTLIHSHAQISPPSCPRKLDKDIAHVFNTLAKLLKRRLRTTNRYGMISFREPLYQIIHRKN